MMNDDAVHTIYTLKKLNSDDDDYNAKLSQLTEGRSTRKLLKAFSAVLLFSKDVFYIYIYCRTFNTEFNKLIKIVGHLLVFIEKRC